MSRPVAAAANDLKVRQGRLGARQDVTQDLASSIQGLAGESVVTVLGRANGAAVEVTGTDAAKQAPEVFARAKKALGR